MGEVGSAPLRRAAFGATLAYAMTAGTFQYFAVAVLAPLIMADLGVSRAGIGGLATLVYLVGGPFSLTASPLTARFGARRLLVALFCVTAVSFAVLASAPAYAWLVVGAAVAGVAVGFTNPVTNQLLAVHLPEGRRGVIVGVKQSGVQLGGVVAGLALPALALGVGWRGAFWACAAVVALGAVLALGAVPRDPPAVRTRAPAAPGVATTWVRWLCGYAFLMGAAVASVGIYLPLYAHEELGFSVPLAGVAVMVLGGVGTLARVVWGAVAERVRSTAALLALIGAGSVAAQALLWAAVAVGAWALWAGVVVYGATASAWMAVVMSAVVRDAPSGTAARQSGYVQLAFYAGFVLSPVAVGAAVDRTGSYAPGWAVLLALFTAATAVALAWRRRA